MFFFTKLAGALLKPLSLVLGALLIGLVLAALTRYRRSGLALVGLATLTLALISWWPIANTFIEPLERHHPVTPPLPHDVAAIVVLGGGGIDAPALPLTAQLSSSSLQRLVEGIRLWRLRPEALLVTSGALPHGRSQAQIAADLAVALGVPRTRIRTLPDARNTEEEAAAYADLAEALQGSAGRPGEGLGTASGTAQGTASGAAPGSATSGGSDGDAPGLSQSLRRPVVVSSASHLPRAMAYFRQEGLDPLPAPTAHRALPQRFATPGDFAPQADDLRTTESAWHELLGRLWASLRGRG